jgi:hypothetical protein
MSRLRFLTSAAFCSNLVTPPPSTNKSRGAGGSASSSFDLSPPYLLPYTAPNSPDSTKSRMEAAASLHVMVSSAAVLLPPSSLSPSSPAYAWGDWYESCCCPLLQVRGPPVINGNICSELLLNPLLVQTDAAAAESCVKRQALDEALKRSIEKTASNKGAGKRETAAMRRREGCSGSTSAGRSWVASSAGSLFSLLLVLFAALLAIRSYVRT